MLSAGVFIGLWSCLLATPQDDKTFQPAIKKFQDDYYRIGAKDDEKIAAVNALAAYKHDRIVKVLAPLLTEASLPVRIMTARALCSFAGVESAPHELLGALQAQANSGKKQAAVRIEILRGLGNMKVRSGAAEIAKFVDDKDDWVAKAAIDAVGRIRAPEAMEALIRTLRRIEGKEGDSEISVNPVDDIFGELGRASLLKPDARQPRRPSEREFLRTPILSALQAITKEKFTVAKDWDAWWSKNKATFRVND